MRHKLLTSCMSAYLFMNSQSRVWSAYQCCSHFLCQWHATPGNVKKMSLKWSVKLVIVTANRLRIWKLGMFYQIFHGTTLPGSVWNHDCHFFYWGAWSLIIYESVTIQLNQVNTWSFINPSYHSYLIYILSWIGLLFYLYTCIYLVVIRYLASPGNRCFSEVQPAVWVKGSEAADGRRTVEAAALLGKKKRRRAGNETFSMDFRHANGPRLLSPLWKEAAGVCGRAPPRHIWKIDRRQNSRKKINGYWRRCFLRAALIRRVDSRVMKTFCRTAILLRHAHRLIKSDATVRYECSRRMWKTCSF